MDANAINNTATEGDIAVVKTKLGKRFVAIYMLAPGIDYFWCPVISGSGSNALEDPCISWVLIGHVI